LTKNASTVRAAATSLDHAADNLAAGRGQARELDAAIADAVDAIATTRREGEIFRDE
jgi:hypothetical protein